MFVIETSWYVLINVDTCQYSHLLVFDALSIGSGPVAAVFVCIKRDATKYQVREDQESKMDSKSQKTLRQIEQNDDQMTSLKISSALLEVDGGFKSSDASDYSRLGAAIGNNTHLKSLDVARG